MAPPETEDFVTVEVELGFGFSSGIIIEPAFSSPKRWSPRLAQGPWSEGWGPALSHLVGALHSLLGSGGAAGPAGPPHLLHLFLCQGSDASILVSQLSWNSRAGNFVSMAEFENSSLGAVQVVNGLYGHCVGTWFPQTPGGSTPTCSPPFTDCIGFYPKGRPCPLHERLQRCAPPETTLVTGKVFQGEGLGEASFISPADLEMLSGLTLPSFIDQRQGGNYRL